MEGSNNTGTSKNKKKNNKKNKNKQKQGIPNEDPQPVEEINQQTTESQQSNLNEEQTLNEEIVHSDNNAQIEETTLTRESRIDPIVIEEQKDQIQEDQIENSLNQEPIDNQQEQSLEKVLQPISPLQETQKSSPIKETASPVNIQEQRSETSDHPLKTAKVGDETIHIYDTNETKNQNDENSKSEIQIIKASSELPTNLSQNQTNPEKQVNEPPFQQQRSQVSSNVFDDDSISSVSYNSKLYFQNMDSISQIGDNLAAEVGDHFDLGGIKEELKKREDKIRELHNEKVKLRNLLKKAKMAIDSSTSKFKSSQESVKSLEAKLQEAIERNADLAHTLEIFQQKRNGIQKENVKQILARINVNDFGYTLIETTELDTEWYKDSQILNIQEQLSSQWRACQQVKYSTIFKDITNLEQQLVCCVQQYEERLKRTETYLESNNSQYINIQQEFKKSREKYENEQKQRDQFLQKLIHKSIELKNQVLTIDEKKIPTSKKINQFQLNQIGELINELELQISKLMELKEESGSILMELRDHLIDLYSKVGIGLLKKHQNYDEEAIKRDLDWNKTMDKLIEENSKIKDESKFQIMFNINIEEKKEDELNDQILKLGNQLNELKSEHYSLVRESKEQSEKLNKELNNSVNSHYLKNIILSYMTTNDHSVQHNLIKVISKAMKFDDEDQDKIMQFHEENNKSTFEKILGGLF